MPILHNYIQTHSHIIHEIQFAQPHYITHQPIRVHDSFSPCFWLPSNWIYAAEISSPGVKNMGGTMAWLSGFGGLPQMQFFHTLLPVWLLSACLAHLAIMGHLRMLVILMNWGETMATVERVRARGRGRARERARVRARARARARARERGPHG